MSLNSIIEQKYLPEVKAFLSLVGTYMDSWRGASTYEERSVIESEVLETFSRLNSLETRVRDLVAGEQPDVDEMEETYRDYELLLFLVTAKLDELQDMFVKHFNTQQLTLLSLTGRMRRIKQKRAALNLYGNGVARYVLAEKFDNYDQLESSYTSLEECEVDTTQGILTLPVQSRRRLSPTKIRIGQGSNGHPGNSDVAVTTNNIDPRFVSNGDPNNWFEYERMDAGPCQLSLVFEFPQAQIVNRVEIEPLNAGAVPSYEIEDILFTVTGGLQVSVKSLMAQPPDEFWTVTSLDADTAWGVTFLPTKAKAVTVKFRQDQQHETEVAVTFARNPVTRDRWAVGIKDVGIYRMQYAQSGGINSTQLPLPGGVYAAEPGADIWPRDFQLYSHDLETSIDGGETWVDSSLTGLDDTTLLLGDESSFMWRLGFTRDDEAFKNIKSLVDTSSRSVATNSILRTVSRYQSPAEIGLDEQPGDGNLLVIQPQIGMRGRFSARGAAGRGILLGEGNGIQTAFDLPVRIIDKDLEQDNLEIYVNRQLYTLTEDNTDLGANEWAYSDDFEEIVFGPALVAGSRVVAVFDAELVDLEERSDGYYHEMNMLFDPDIENIELEYLPRSSQRETVLISRRRKVVNLGFRNIVESSWTLSSSTGASYTEQTSKTDLFAASSGSYYVDYANGVLYFHTATGADSVRVSFTHRNYIDVPKTDFEIVMADNLPWGIKIPKNRLEAETLTDTVGAGVLSRVDVQTGEVGPRPDPLTLADNAMTLTEDNVIRGSVSVSTGLVGGSVAPEEVEYQDGRTEFLGLIPMNEEYTVSTAAVGNLVTFNLAAGALWYKGFDVLFSDTNVFKYEVSSLALVTVDGYYYVSPTGEVTVHTNGNDLPADISVNYYYRDPTFDPDNKFSVNYSKGTLFSYEDLVAGQTISYKASSYKASYSLAQVVDSFEYSATNNVVKVRTEGLRDSNSLVKIIWTDQRVGETAEDLKGYFTPILSLLAFRFQ